MSRRNESILWLILVVLAAFLRFGPIGSNLPYIGYVDEGHGFTKKANEIRAYKAILDFFDKHLKERGPAVTAAGSN